MVTTNVFFLSQRGWSLSQTDRYTLYGKKRDLLFYQECYPEDGYIVWFFEYNDNIVLDGVGSISETDYDTFAAYLSTQEYLFETPSSSSNMYDLESDWFRKKR
jgi:hypothetical protein